MIIVQNSLVTTTYNKEQNMLISIYKGRVNIGLALNQLEKLNAFYASNKVTRSLIDVSSLYGSFAKLFEQFNKNYPSVLVSGLKVSAYVISDDVIVNNLIAKYQVIANKNGVNTKIFTNYQEAEKWITSIK